MMPSPTEPSPPDNAGTAVNLAHRLLCGAESDLTDLCHLLGEVAASFRVRAAGLASLPEGRTLACHPDLDPEDRAAPPWVADPALIPRAAAERVGLSVPHAGGQLALAVFARADLTPCLIWLEKDSTEAFTAGELAALTLVSAALGRHVGGDYRTRWDEWLDRRARQQRLEVSAAVARRLAHDFGNVLTGILGFTELALTQQTPTHSPLHSYLEEIYRAAQHGAHYTHQLRLFSRRQSTSSRTCHLGEILAAEQARLLAAQPAGMSFQVQVPADLPAVGLDAEHLHQVLGAVLDNAREALPGSGTISVSARAVELDAVDCGMVYGAARPGPHVEVVIADTGVGLSPEAEKHVLVDPFFSTKPRRKGFGLSVSYGILAAHRGGIRLHAGEERGVVVRIVLPAGAPVRNPTPAGAARGERLLVVDDEPDVLRFLTTSLEHAGYRVHGVDTAEAAYQAYFAQPDDTFSLVLTDVLMPGLGGVELVRRLLRRDPAGRVLFISGQVSPDFSQTDLARHHFEFLDKPFRADQLLRTVRAVLDRAPARTEAGVGLAPALR